MMVSLEHPPKDEGVMTLFESMMTWGDRCAVRYEMWVQDGLRGESLIFAAADVADLSHEALIQEVRASTLCQADSEITLGQSHPDFLFVNFNFVLL